MILLAKPSVLTAKLKCRNMLPSMRQVQSLVTQMMERRLDKPGIDNLLNGKVKHLTSLPFASSVREHQTRSF